MKAPSLWIKWNDKAPAGYVRTEVYNASSDSYLFCLSAPAVFIGYQEGLPATDTRDAVPGFALYNLTADIPGHPVGSTVSADTLRAAGFLPSSS